MSEAGSLAVEANAFNRDANVLHLTSSSLSVLAHETEIILMFSHVPLIVYSPHNGQKDCTKYD